MDAQKLRAIIDEWIDRNGPDGLLKLAQKSGVSSSTITRARLGVRPKKASTRIRLAEALGRNEAIFGAVSAADNHAS
jgi:transcriptional regulator with XRE-family HTH domain